jgi:hypothetical protein
VENRPARTTFTSQGYRLARKVERSHVRARLDDDLIAGLCDVDSGLDCRLIDWDDDDVRRCRKAEIKRTQAKDENAVNQ